MDKSSSFNQKELNFLEDTDFLLTKRKLLKQLQGLLALSQEQLKQALNNQPLSLPAHCLQQAGKISRGENYRGLPYLLLDYPRLFTRDDIFAFRSMFWWGHFFSCTLHLQGHSLALYRTQLKKNLLQQPQMLPADSWISVNSTPWEYHYQEGNYRLLRELTAGELDLLLDREFVKISRKMPLSQYGELPAFSRNCLLQFLSCLQPRG